MSVCDKEGLAARSWPRSAEYGIVFDCIRNSRGVSALQAAQGASVDGNLNKLSESLTRHIETGPQVTCDVNRGRDNVSLQIHKVCE